MNETMMIETGLMFIKSLPHWLSSVVEVLVVAVVFMTCVTFLAGIWCGLRIIGKRANSIREIDFIPPRIFFKDSNDNDKSDHKQ